MDEVVLILEVAEDAPPELAKAMLDACAAAAIEGRCSFGAETGAKGTPRAAIRWGPDHLDAKLAVTVDAVASERTLRFLPQDPITERWRSVGLVSATIVGEARRAKEREAKAAALVQSKPASPPPKPRAPEPAAKPDLPYERLVVDAAVVVGNGLEGGTPRAGASARMALLVPKTPLLLDVATSFSVRPTDDRGLQARWVTVGGGIGVRGAALDRTLAIEGRLEGFAEWSGASIREGGAGDSGGRLQPALGAGAGIAWMFSRMIGLAAGIEGQLVPSGTVFRVRGDAFGRSPPVHVLGSLGVRLGLL